MISLSLAQKLNEAGLVWVAGRHDFFAIPGRGMDEQVFVLSDMMARLEILQGWPVVAFHGAAEWALDYIYTADVVWLPTESQLRSQLAAALNGAPGGGFALIRDGESYVCRLGQGSESLAFGGQTAEEAYGEALLHVLRTQNSADGV